MGTLSARLIAAAALLIGLTAAAAPPYIGPFERIEQLKDEPVASIRVAFQKVDPRLYWTQVHEKQPANGDSSIMLVQAAPLSDARRTGYMNPDLTQSRYGLFLVSGPGNHVESTLDIFRPPADFATPVLEPPVKGRVYVHWEGFYGLYLGTYRYEYQAGRQERARKSEYERLAVTFVASEGSRLYYRAFYDPSGRPLGMNRPPAQNAGLIFDTESREFTITATPPTPPPARQPPDWVRRRLPDAMGSHTAKGDPARLRRDLWAAVSTGGLHLFTPGGNPAFYQVRAPSRQQLAEARPELAARASAGISSYNPEAGFGPLALRGNTLWFLNRFYDGEGQTGIGFVGRIRLGEPGVEARYLPEIACCAGSALYVTPNGEEVLYAGLAEYTEGMPIGRGLLRCHPESGKTRYFPVPDTISDIRPAGEALAMATSHGLYLLEGDSLAHYRIEPAADGGVELVTITLPSP
ncbi:MAG: hypothetical protein KJZ84_17460 [Bryobacteraceae bacterium]|nr:hypothetical protein [Bryobacteraceae bacterium]